MVTYTKRFNIRYIIDLKTNQKYPHAWIIGKLFSLKRRMAKLPKGKKNAPRVYNLLVNKGLIF